MDGIVVVNKAQGFTSMDCCAIIRRLAGERKAGHTGTLDPNASGVLPVCVGKATRLIEYMDLGPKTYVATARLGIRTDSEDIWGNVIEEGCGACKGNVRKVDRDDIELALSLFKGEIMQTPPMYSAIKIDGQRLYKLARQGVSVERKPRPVTIYETELLDFNYGAQEFSFRIKCSRGTYVRSICAEIGEKLGTGAAMSALVRTECCGFSLDDAQDIIELKEGRLQPAIKPLESGIANLATLEISDKESFLFLNGNPAWSDNLDPGEGIKAVYSGGQLLGIIKDGIITKVLK
ncbi:MAG: tRNA pseudouridine(55) synthase TruB [Firmicutes bacterium]|nr:tRNA pseudouridine(55) synthase TruB [Bacillota bacterium]